MTESTESNLACPWCYEWTLDFASKCGDIEAHRCRLCKRVVNIKNRGEGICR